MIQATPRLPRTKALASVARGSGPLAVAWGPRAAGPFALCQPAPAGSSKSWTRVARRRCAISRALRSADGSRATAPAGHARSVCTGDTSARVPALRPAREDSRSRNAVRLRRFPWLRAPGGAQTSGARPVDGWVRCSVRLASPCFSLVPPDCNLVSTAGQVTLIPRTVLALHSDAP